MKKIGIIGAMEVEIASLKSAMKVSRMLKKAQMEFLEGELEGCQAVVVRSGIGKVNAAVCTQILVDEFGVDGYPQMCCIMIWMLQALVIRLVRFRRWMPSLSRQMNR